MSQELIFWATIVHQDMIPPAKTGNRSTKVSSDDFTQYHLSTSLDQRFPVGFAGFAGTEANEYSGVFILA